jgi:hypothetical protein
MCPHWFCPVSECVCVCMYVRVCVHACAIVGVSTRRESGGGQFTKLMSAMMGPDDGGVPGVAVRVVPKMGGDGIVTWPPYWNSCMQAAGTTDAYLQRPSWVFMSICINYCVDCCIFCISRQVTRSIMGLV